MSNTSRTIIGTVTINRQTGEVVEDEPSSLDGSPFPFECENCGHKPTPKEVLDYHGDCAKCGDTIVAYTVDAAECILRLMETKKVHP